MSSLPYISSPGNIEKALAGIKTAAVPPSVSQDFVKTILKIPGGSGDQITSFLKKLGFAGSDGKPTESYTKFRNPTTSEQTMATVIKHTYARLYVRNEYMHNLTDEELLGLIIEETGQAHDSRSVRLTLGCISALKKYANFSETIEVQPEPLEDISPKQQPESTQPMNMALPQKASRSVGLNLGYTINLNLPATSDPAVFNAIFKSLKEHLLRDDDA